jgi:hypothetical protein
MIAAASARCARRLTACRCRTRARDDAAARGLATGEASTERGLAPRSPTTRPAGSRENLDDLPALEDLRRRRCR